MAKERKVTMSRALVTLAERAITLDDLQRLRSLVVSEPQAPEGDWYKDFGWLVQYPRSPVLDLQRSGVTELSIVRATEL